MQADSDLGARPVTVAVGLLSAADRAKALTAGLIQAEALRRQGLIESAALFLQSDHRVAGPLPLIALPTQELALA
jgi:hypothetical protein